MKCPRCGSVMVEMPPARYYLSDPPQWEKIMWCACGHSENFGIVSGKTRDQLLMDEWKAANAGSKKREGYL